MILNITGSIDETAYDKLCDFLQDGGGTNITIQINSGGGNHLDSLAMYSVIRAYGGQVTTIAVGACHSAAVLVFAAGDVRVSAEESWFMVHEDSGKISGSVTELHSEIACMVRKEHQWADIMESRTGTATREWDELSKATTYFSAKEAKELGLVHKYLKVKK